MTITHIKSRWRDVAQFGSALPWGGRGREFESHRSDHFFISYDFLAPFESISSQVLTLYHLR